MEWADYVYLWSSFATWVIQLVEIGFKIVGDFLSFIELLVGKIVLRRLHKFDRYTDNDNSESFGQLYDFSIVDRILI